ncbi:UNVERIFIED_CONTAM: class I SAM-dependent methyltransferase [Halobacillus marinus]|uniref:class I SAM-dependent methyltransferase n=1 Tax=Halobacillus sp. BAB-2008 TaxID=1246484 RepID=UPI0002A5172C|nr:class I SAM-dependent methyltransferase [Halobacillus sp. BAB-2008]ELK49067.1 hypothetical protein D479_00515 [Halobacillus sp. BAB-2008]
MNEWITVMQARKWMKKNESFLPIWHAYVGSELDLFDEFETARTIDVISEKTGYPMDLLSSWVKVGVAVKHLKKRPGGRYRTSKKHCASLMGERSSPGVKALLKEMMELHIPTLLQYPDIMRSLERAEFDHDRHGEVVAETSALLEHFAMKKIMKTLRDKDIDTVIDLGCGNGCYLRKLAATYPSVRMIGVDINQKVIESARAASEGYPNIEFVVGDVHDWNPEDRKADVVLLHNLFHYIHPDERSGLLEQMHGYVKPDGLISVITPMNETMYGEAFSSAFNSFFVAHSNLFALPDKAELERVTNKSNYDLFDLDPIVKEGSWYTCWLSPSSPVQEARQTGTDSREQVPVSAGESAWTRSS